MELTSICRIVEKGTPEIFNQVLAAMLVFVELHYVKPAQIMVKEGLSAMFDCASYSKPGWTFNNGRLPKNALPLAQFGLFISKVKAFNYGYYECSGDSSDGSAFKSYGMLIVLGKRSVLMSMGTSFHDTNAL